MDDDVLVLAVGLLGAGATLAGVWITAALEGHRKQRSSIQHARRTLRLFQDARRTGDRWNQPAEPDQRVERAEARHRATSLLHEIEILVPDLPRRVRYLVQKSIEVLDERHRLGESEDRVAATVVWSADRALREASESGLVRLWSPRNRRRARLDDSTREYVDYLQVLHEGDEENHRQQIEDWKRSQAKRQMGKRPLEGTPPVTSATNGT